MTVADQSFKDYYKAHFEEPTGKEFDKLTEEEQDAFEDLYNIHKQLSQKATFLLKFYGWMMPNTSSMEYLSELIEFMWPTGSVKRTEFETHWLEKQYDYLQAVQAQLDESKAREKLVGIDGKPLAESDGLVLPDTTKPGGL